MAKFITQRLFSMLLTMLIVSIAVFLISEAAPGDIARHILGPFATPEQVDLFRAQLGLKEPLYLRYVNWLFGSDWRASKLVGYPLERTEDARSGKVTWWANVDGTLTRWKMKEGQVITYRRQADGTVEKDESPFTGWQTDKEGQEYFWGVDTANHATLWKKGVSEEEVGPASAGRAAVEQTGGIEYIPLQKGLLRGDPGVSFRTGRPVADTLFIRLRNSLLLAGIAFIVVMPLALLLGIIAGLNEGRLIDRILTIGGLITTASPNFATGIFLILIFAAWLKVLPGAVVLLDDKAIFQNLNMLILPVATLTLIELGYVLRITRASIVEVMNASYIRTAFLKGLPYWRIVLQHALRNALMAPITVIMLHVNWLMGGIVVVEVLFSFPGLGQYLLDSALFNDVYAIEAGSMIMVLLAVGTQLLADIIYTFLNPRIRYA
ncbi:MAG: peptide ABC transporter permease [Anaerolineaceae bacterium 4572_32.1]|nr:MAG: peptide ABC transporter permease [Anaerolineaceae bacterium 4572_32.1]